LEYYIWKPIECISSKRLVMNWIRKKYW
jgi:hypothetical protein